MVREACRHLSIWHVGAVTVCRFVPDSLLDERVVDEVRQELVHLVDNEQTGKLLLNFSSVKLIHSIGLAALVTLNRKVKTCGGKLILCGMRPDVREVFAVSRLTKLFDIEDTEADALAAF